MRSPSLAAARAAKALAASHRETAASKERRIEELEERARLYGDSVKQSAVAKALEKKWLRFLRLRPALGGTDLTFCDNRQIRVFWSCGTSLRSPHHAPPSGHGWFDGAQRAPSNHPTPVTGSERAQPQEVPNRANSARLAAPLA